MTIEFDVYSVLSLVDIFVSKCNLNKLSCEKFFIFPQRYFTILV